MTNTHSTLYRTTRLSVMVLLATILLNVSAVLAQPAPNTARNFAVLGATTVTNTGPTILTGELGVSPGTAITGFPPGIVLGGTIHRADMAAFQAHADATMAYARLRNMVCPASNNLTGQVLGMTVLTLPSGVYCFSSSAQLTGTLFLAGTGPWVFQVGSALTTASASRVVVLDPAANCNVFWQIGSSATLGTATQFVGDIVALTSITATTRVSSTGSLLALTGAVTLDTNRVSACRVGGVPPDPDPDPDPDDDTCKCKCHHHGDGHGDHDGDHHDGDHHGDHHDGDDVGHHGGKDDKDHGKSYNDHKDNDRDRDYDNDRDKNRKDNDNKRKY